MIELTERFFNDGSGRVWRIVDDGGRQEQTSQWLCVADGYVEVVLLNVGKNLVNPFILGLVKDRSYVECVGIYHHGGKEVLIDRLVNIYPLGYTADLAQVGKAYICHN
jgi:hypothetical protein